MNSYYYVPGTMLPGSMLYNDPNATGGVCRARCHSQSNPTECCRVKSMMPQCKDADCAGPMYTGTTQAPLVYTYPMPQYPGTVPQYPGQYIAPGAYMPTALPITTQAPMVTYGTQDLLLSSMPGQYIVPPQFSTYTNTYGTFLPPSIYANPYGASLLASDCKSWPPCYLHPNPTECCRLKPRTCYDQDCIGGSYSGRAPLTINSSPQAQQVQYQQMMMPGADCRTWQPCHLSKNPKLCCAKKPPGCDPACAGPLYMSPKQGVYQIAYDGSTFNGKYDAAVDDLYGVE